MSDSGSSRSVRRGSRSAESPLPFSYAKLALYSLGSAAAVLVVVGALVIWLAKYDKIFALLAGLGGVAASVAVMGLVARRATEKMLDPKTDEN